MVLIWWNNGPRDDHKISIVKILIIKEQKANKKKTLAFGEFSKIFLKSHVLKEILKLFQILFFNAILYLIIMFSNFTLLITHDGGERWLSG